MLIKKKTYLSEIDDNTGNINFLSLLSDNSGHNIIDTTGHFGALCYTLKDEMPDIIERYAQKGKTYILKDHIALFNKVHGSDFTFENKEHKSTLEYIFEDDSITLTLDCNDDKLSQFGLSLDIDMIDKDQNGDYKTQFLPIFPYSSDEGKLKFYAMSRPDDVWILFLSLCESAGWRIVYNRENEHILDGFQLLSQFDSRISEEKWKSPLKIRVSFHNSYEEVLETVKELTGVQLPNSVSYGMAVGETVYASVGNDEKAVLKTFNDQIVDLENNNGTVCFIPE